MTDSAFSQLVALCAGLLLLTGVLVAWRRSLVAEVRLLAIQGAGLAGLVAVIGVHGRSTELTCIAFLVLGLKAGVLPAVLSRVVVRSGSTRGEAPLINTTASLISLSLLTMLAYLVSSPIQAGSSGAATAAVPVGVALLLFGFLVLATRRHAVSQLVGFLMLDNGIATVAFLISEGVPLVVELGVSLDVLLVVLILQVLTGRIVTEFGAMDLDDLTELRD